MQFEKLDVLDKKTGCAWAKEAKELATMLAGLKQSISERSR